MICVTCHGPAHPATGAQYSATCITCYRCTVAAWAWVKKHTDEKGLRKGMPFYEYVNVLSDPLPVSPKDLAAVVERQRRRAAGLCTAIDCFEGYVQPPCDCCGWPPEPCPVFKGSGKARVTTVRGVRRG